MTPKKWILIVVFSSPLFGNDTPFLRYQCHLGKVDSTPDYFLELKNDDTPEIYHWVASSIKKMRITFEKTDRRFVSVRVKTGAPLISYAAPEEYKFSAPLVTDSFDFSIVLKDPLQLDGVIFSLNCLKFSEME